MMNKTKKIAATLTMSAFIFGMAPAVFAAAPVTSNTAAKTNVKTTATTKVESAKNTATTKAVSGQVTTKVKNEVKTVKNPVKTTKSAVKKIPSNQKKYEKPAAPAPQK